MGNFKLFTKNGYDFFEVASALQKSIRRNDVMVAAYFGVELWASGYGNYVWKRLLSALSTPVWQRMLMRSITAIWKCSSVNIKTPKKWWSC